jgi:hypothetical protein
MIGLRKKKEDVLIESVINENSIESNNIKKEKKEVFRLNVSEGKDNYSQRKSKYIHEQKGQYGTNTINWTCVCNVHALGMAALYSGWIFPKSAYEREPDALADYTITECNKENNWFKQKMPQLWKNWYEGDPNAYTPLELHEVLAHYFNEYMGCSKADTFTTTATMKDIVKQLYENRIAIPTSVQWGGLKGHIITIVGFEATSEDDLIKWINDKLDKCPITHFIYDDPYGYRDPIANKYDGTKSGNDNIMSYEDFNRYVKNINMPNKYAHILKRPAAII